jgi:alkaline phosphatase
MVTCLVIICFPAIAQTLHRAYTTANAHSHNDYEQAHPFREAWQNGFGSIEADIFLYDNKLIVAHDRKEMMAGRSLDSLYLNPLKQCILDNKGYVYPDTNRCLQLMIDVKSEAMTTLKSLVEKLNDYPALVKCSSLRIVISGNRPDPSLFSGFPSWIWFDGELKKEYSGEELKKIAMLSDDFARYSKWQGEGDLNAEERQELQNMVNKVHREGKKIRFWNAPDAAHAWHVFIDLGVDFINTDHINELSIFLKNLPG